MPEELAFEELAGNRRAVHLDEGPATARALLVDAMRHQLLARPRLALDEHGGPGGRHQGDLREDLPERRAVADHVAAAERRRHLVAQVGVLHLEPPAQAVDLGERAGVRDRDRGLVGERAQPAEPSGVDRGAAEDPEHAEHVAPEDERLAGEAPDALAPGPVGARDPAAGVGRVLDQYPAPRGAEVTDLARPEWESAEVAVET
jgi:hypothetical protein